MNIVNKLLEIQQTIGEKQSVVHNIRKEVILARIHSGHARVTDSYLLLGENSHNVLVVMHRLLYVTFLECGYFAQARNKCCNMYGVYLFNMFTKFLLTQILEILMVNKLL